MYPELRLPLVVALAAALAFVAFLVLGRPVLRRLALRQVVRRPSEALLVVLGSVLGTALIVTSLVVGDSLDRSVRQTAYDVLGPIDEYVSSGTLAQAEQVSDRLQPLSEDPQVDGVLPVIGERVAATRESGGQSRAEPLVFVWELDFDDASRFGAPDSSGLSVADPGRGGVVVNRRLADSLGVSRGDPLTFHLYGRTLGARVSDVVPAEGLAGMGVGAAVNYDAFFTPGTIVDAARAARRQPTIIRTYLSNAGDVETGAELTGEVSDKARAALGPLTRQGAAVGSPKQEVLDAAEQTGDALGSLFVFLGSFSIIAGVLLLVNVFVMLADERKGQLGILRAIGLRRRRVTAAFSIEGAVYAAVAAVLGTLLGLGLGRLVVVLAINILNTYDSGANQIAVTFAVTPTSIINGFALGFLIAFVAVVLTSIRIARINIIAAIRDLDTVPRHRTRRRLVIASVISTALFAAAAVPAVVNSTGATTYLFPALAAVCAIPLLSRFMPAGTALTGVALAVMAWGVGANLVRPHMYDDASTATYVVLGCMLAFSAVTLVSQHQALLLRPLRSLIDRPTQTGLATRLAVAYPTARRFRTGATLAMYSVVVLVIVLLTEISAVIDAGVEKAVTDASGGWTLRVDYNPNSPLPRAQDATTSGRFTGRVREVAPLVVAPAEGNDPRGLTDERLPVTAVGVTGRLAAHGPTIEEHLASLPDSAATWSLVAHDSRYVLVDGIYGQTGGPQSAGVEPGATLRLTDPTTGRTVERTVAGVVSDGTAFYGIGGGEFRYPVFMSDLAARTSFTTAAASSLLLRAAPGEDTARLRADLQSEFVANGVVATDIRQAVHDSFTANRQFFQLMRGYLALGLLVGISSLGVIMIRAVRERRRTIGVLRALGVGAPTVRRAFMGESTFVAVEGTIIGAVLGVVTTWVLYSNSPAFGTLDASFPIAWTSLGLTLGATLVASLLATLWPARRAASIRPAVAVRVAE